MLWRLRRTGVQFIFASMRKYSRREFLSLSAILASGYTLAKLPFANTLAARQLPSTTESPDLILVNGKVLTMDPASPTAEAFAVKFGRFSAIGSNADVRNLATRDTPVIDAGGMTVLPGFIDCHCHPSGVEELYEVNANKRSIKELQDALREKAAKTPPGFWVNAYMFDDTKLADGPLHR